MFEIIHDVVDAFVSRIYVNHVPRKWSYGKNRYRGILIEVEV